MHTQVQPIYLVSVNNTPEVAKKLVAELIDDIKKQYNIVHVANADAISHLKPLLSLLVHEPQLLICSSQWTETEQDDVRRTAEEQFPSIRTVVIPPGLYATKGGEDVVAFLKETILGLGLPQSGVRTHTVSCIQIYESKV